VLLSRVYVDLLLIWLYRMETLKRHLPVSGQEGVQELKKIAVRFEEKIYSAATSQVCSLNLFLICSNCKASS